MMTRGRQSLQMIYIYTVNASQSIFGVSHQILKAKQQ